MSMFASSVPLGSVVPPPSTLIGGDGVVQAEAVEVRGRVGCGVWRELDERDLLAGARSARAVSRPPTPYSDPTWSGVQKLVARRRRRRRARSEPVGVRRRRAHWRAVAAPGELSSRGACRGVSRSGRGSRRGRRRWCSGTSGASRAKKRLVAIGRAVPLHRHAERTRRGARRSCAPHREPVDAGVGETARRAATRSPRAICCALGPNIAHELTRREILLVDRRRRVTGPGEQLPAARRGCDGESTTSKRQRLAVRQCAERGRARAGCVARAGRDGSRRRRPGRDGLRRQDRRHHRQHHQCRRPRPQPGHASLSRLEGGPSRLSTIARPD